METLEEWLKSNAGSLPSIVQKWADKLIELGASWDTFSGSNETIDDLVDGGIPRLSARDICRVMNEVVQRRSRPLIIFWDIENVQIPNEKSAAHVVSQIKGAVQPYGQVKQFRAYASVSLGNIPEEKRSELHLSGCNLVDSPHLGRKEVADKMIIVDAMEFAYTHLEGATLCFITGDIDYAYLLSKLQKPTWTTIVISKGSDETMLHANCNVNLRWETDILKQSPHQLTDRSTSTSELAASASGGDSATIEESTLAMSNMNVNNHMNHDSTNEIITGDRKNLLIPNHVIHDTTTHQSLPTPHPPLSTSDIELLQKIVVEGTNVGDDSPGTLKSYVGSMLKQSQPQRFAGRSAIKVFLAKAIDRGVVYETETGDGVKHLHLIRAYPNLVQMKVSEKAPLNESDLPQKVLLHCKQLKFIIFVKKMHVPKGSSIPGTFVQGTDTYLILMFNSLKDAQSLAVKLPWLLKHGVLVNWSACKSKTNLEIEVTNCALCNVLTRKHDLYCVAGESGAVCRVCFDFSNTWSEAEQREAQEKVLALLQMSAEYDDFIVPRTIFRTVLLEKYPSSCASRGHASLWIDSAVEAGIAVETKHCASKRTKVLLLPENAAFATIPHSNLDTSEMEKFVTDLLWSNNGVMDRKDINDTLRGKYPLMAQPMMCSLVMHNAASKKSFFVARRSHGQMVGLTHEDALTALIDNSERAKSNKKLDILTQEEKLGIDSSSDDSCSSDDSSSSVDSDSTDNSSYSWLPSMSSDNLGSGRIYLDDKLKMGANLMRQEWLKTPDKSKLEKFMDEVNASPNASKIIVQTNIDYTADCKWEELKPIICMIEHLFRAGKVSKSDIVSAMADLVEYIDIFACDNPQIYEFVGEMFCVFANMQALTVAWLADCASKITSDSCKFKVIECAMLSIRKAYGMDAIRSTWTDESERSALALALGHVQFEELCLSLLQRS